MDDTQSKIMDVLVALGVDEKEALCLVFLDMKNPYSMMNIEDSTGLRQPVVSKAMNQVHLKSWVSCNIKKVSGKGRPQQEYVLRASIRDIIKNLKENFEAKQKNELDKINELIKEIGVKGQKKLVEGE